MTDHHRPDDICALCDEFSVKRANPEYASLGMGRCLGEERIVRHVAWDSRTCITFRLDKPNIAARRQYVQQQRNKEQS